MILFLDSSALVKLFTHEPGTEEARSFAENAEALAASRIAYVESRAALARAAAERQVISGEARYGRRALERIWAEIGAIEVDRDLAIFAGDLADRHVLRGMAAIHLASAMSLRDSTERQVSFATWDERLRRAAKAEGLTTVPA